MSSVTLDLMIERRPDLTCFVRIPATTLDTLGAPAGGTVGVTLAGHPIGQRGLVRYDAGTFSLPLNAAHLRLAGGRSAGDRLEVVLTVPDPSPPPEPTSAPARRSRKK